MRACLFLNGLHPVRALGQLTRLQRRLVGYHTIQTSLLCGKNMLFTAAFVYIQVLGRLSLSQGSGTGTVVNMRNMLSDNWVCLG